MVGGLISNALSAGAGSGLITSALCMQIKKSDTAKLIIHFDLYEVLKSDLSGFYNTITPLVKVNVKFSVLDLSRNIVYTSPNNIFTNGTAVELPNGKYIVKLLFSAYGFAGGEEQAVTVSGETVYTVKLYKRHFKAMTVIDSNYEVYNGTRLAVNVGQSGSTGEANEVKAISQINVFELKWDSWVKILNFDCVPESYRGTDTVQTFYEQASGQYSNVRIYETRYVKGVVTSKSGISKGWYSGAYTDNFVGWENNKAIFQHRGVQNYDSQYTSEELGFNNLDYMYNAAMLYHDKKSYDENSIDDDFFSEYKGMVLLKREQESPEVMYFFGDPRTYVSDIPIDFVKIYLPSVNYFNEELLSEREIAEQNGAHFWNESLGAVKINEDGTVQNYVSKMIYNGLEVMKINSVDFLWYSDDYDH